MHVIGPHADSASDSRPISSLAFLLSDRAGWDLPCPPAAVEARPISLRHRMNVLLRNPYRLREQRPEGIVCPARIVWTKAQPTAPGGVSAGYENDGSIPSERQRIC